VCDTVQYFHLVCNLFVSYVAFCALGIMKPEAKALRTCTNSIVAVVVVVVVVVVNLAISVYQPRRVTRVSHS